MKPLGNLLLDGGVSIRAAGLGPLLGVLSDEQLLDFLKSYCDAADLLALSRCSKALYIIANEEELWRGLALERWEGDFRFVSDWKNTYALMAQREAWRNKHLAGSSAAAADAAAASAASSSSTAAAAGTSVAPVPSLASDERIPEFALLPAPQRFSGYYSDFLFQAFYCSHIDLETSYGDATAGSAAPTSTAAGTGAGAGAHRPSPASAPLDTITRVHVSELSAERFQREFGAPNRPLIIQGLMDSWPCYAPGPQQWNQQNWSRRFGSQSFKIGRYNMELDRYFAYMDGVCSDESPLYLFDSKFGDKQPELLREYEVPHYFANDFFDLLRDGTPEGEKVRPAFRWILVGPARSGSTWHKDPNMTSAWNGLISGRKKWIMYPPDETPPGVFPSANQAEVCTPISVAEWFINYYGEHRARIEAFEEKKKYEAERQQWHEQQKAKRAATAGAGSEQEQESQPRASKKAKTGTGAAAATATATASAAAAAAASSSAAPLPPAGPVECICEPGEVIFIPHGQFFFAICNRFPASMSCHGPAARASFWMHVQSAHVCCSVFECCCFQAGGTRRST